MSTTVGHNPWLAARREWDERYGDHMRRAQMWRGMAYLLALIALVLIVGMVSIGYRSTTVPYVVAIDSIGRSIPVLPAQQVAANDVRLQAAAMFRWIIAARSVCVDPAVERRQIDDVYASVAAASAASQTLTDWFRSNSPFDRMKNETVDVDVDSVVQQSKNSYEVVWKETERDLYGTLLGTHQYRGIITTVVQPVKDARQALLNPLGIYITNVSWGETLGWKNPNGGPK